MGWEIEPAGTGGHGGAPFPFHRAMRLTAAVNLVRRASASPEQGASADADAGLLLRQGSLALVLQIGNNPVQRTMS